jgi:hypothetical protein
VPTAGTETNLPLVVAVVFAATFLVVGAIAYLILFRQPSDRSAPPTPSPSAPPAPHLDALPVDTTQITLPREEVARRSPVSVPTAPESALPAHPEDAPGVPPATGPSVFVTLYRGLMLVTGLGGLLASSLMLSAVEGVSRLLFTALAIAALSVYFIYRGFVPDAELRTPRR